MAFTNVYSKIGKLRMVHTGNALGMNQNPIIVNDRTQTLMISLDPTLVVAGAGVPSDNGATTYGGTTRTWLSNGSWSNLSLATSDVPVGSTVDKAFLIWNTGYGVSPQPTSAVIISTPIKFTTPDGVTHSITATTSDLGTLQSMCLSAEVTSILNGVISGGIDRALGKYSVSAVPIAVVNGVPGGTGGPAYVGSGWGLVIFYTHPSLSYQSESLSIGILNNGTIQTITGFYAPDSGAVKARIFVECVLSNAPESDNLTLNNLFVCGPNNQHNPPFTVNNFLSSVVCDYLGAINKNCSFGNNNVDPSTYSAGLGVKEDWTITNVAANNYIPNGARTANVLSNGDPSAITALGVEIQVNQAYFTSIKTSDKTIYNPGDTVTYTLPFTNTGGSTATGVFFTDTLPSNLTFVPNSFAVNGVTQPGYTLIDATMPNIRPAVTATVTFKAIVNSSIVTTTTIPNTAWLGYNFISDPLQPPLRDASITNENIITVFKTAATSTKTVDASYGDFGSTLTYTIVLNNVDTNTYTNLIFQDTTPSGTTFVPNSFTVNGVASAQNPNSPVNIGNFPSNSVITLTFKVTVNNTLPNPNPIPNNSTSTYIFTDPFGNTVPTGIASNTPTTQINHGNISSSTKSVDIANAAIGDTLTYTVVLNNTGNITCTNVIFKDTIPSGTTFVSNSLTVNGVAQSGLNPAPPSGANIGDIPANSVATLTFKVTVDTLPTPNPIVNNSSTTYSYSSNPSGPVNGSGGINSNSASTFVSLATFSNNVTKTANKNYATIGDIITYTVVLKNTGNVTANNIVFTDTIPNGTSFVNNSITLNGVAQAGTVAPPTGFNVGSVAPGKVATLTFNVTVVTLPSPNPILNSSNIAYTYTSDPSIPNGKSAQDNSTIASTTINFVSTTTSSKHSNASYADCGQIITYTIVIPNTGNVTAQNVKLIDTIPNGTSFIANSVTVNGVAQSGASPQPPTGVTIGNIAPGATSTVTFDVMVVC